VESTKPRTLCAADDEVMTPATNPRPYTAIAGRPDAVAQRGSGARAHQRARKSSTMRVVAAGCSSMIQWPEPGT